MRIVLCGSRSFGEAVLEQVGRMGHEVALVVSPPADQLHRAASVRSIPWTDATYFSAVKMVECDLLIAAHAHNFVSSVTRRLCQLGAIGYHPSLLPVHRGRSAVEWTVRDRDRIAGGTVYWLDDRVDGGDVAAQDWCFVRPEWSASDLWRHELFPMGLALLADVVADLAGGVIRRVPQDPALATWEPAMDPPRLGRPDMPELPSPSGRRVVYTNELGSNE